MTFFASMDDYVLPKIGLTLKGNELMLEGQILSFIG